MLRSKIYLIGLLYVPALLAQATGTIHGSVYDNSRSSIPEASIVVKNTATTESRTVTADSTGKFVVALLPVGPYTVSVQKDGFNPFIQNNVLLQVNTDIQVDAILQVRGTTEVVTVSANASMVQPSTTNLVQVIDQKRVTDLPLNGRNVLSLVSLSAGVSNVNASGRSLQANTLGNGTYQASVSINGARENGTNYLLDNADFNDNYTNIAQSFPNPDAVQEFSVQTSTFDAQYGRSVGGAVNVVTRGGTNELHGTAFEYLRNYALNAGNFFTGQDSLKRNQFGVALGGPVVIPRVYDGRNKTFVFGSYQGTRTSIATPFRAVAPSAAMKRGDLSGFLGSNGSGAIHDPLSPGQYFPGNVIPANRIDPVVARLLQFMPASTSPDYLLQIPVPAQRTYDNQVLLRLDQELSSRQRLSARYFVLDYDRPWVVNPNSLYYVGVGQNGRAQTAAVNHTFIATPRLVNQLILSYNRNVSRAQPPNELPTFETLGGRVRTLPGNPTMVVGITNWSGISTGVPYYVPQDTYQIAENASYASGRHNLRFGADLKRYRMDFLNPWLTGGTASFSGQLWSDPGKVNAGNAFGEFLLGTMSGWRQQSNSYERVWTNFMAFYVQDDIRATSKLTFNLGLRWDPKFDINEIYGQRTTFVAGRQSTRFPLALPGLLFQGDKGYENGIIPTDWNNLAPRFGVAYQLRPRTVIRAAYGIFYDQLMNIFNNRSMQAEPFLRQAVLTNQGILSDPYRGDAVLDPSAQKPDATFRFRPYNTWAIPTKQMITPWMQNWNFVLEQQLTGDLLLRAAYVGSKGEHLLHSPEANPAIYGPGATPGNVNQRRIYQPLGAVELGRTDAWSKYHSLQLTAQKRYSHGFTMLVNYTWSKSIDIASYGSVEYATTGPNPFNYNDNRGLADFNIPQRFVASGIWVHPGFKDTNAFARAVLGGWQSNFILTAQAGGPITVFSGVDNALMGVGGNFADLTGVDWRFSSSRSKQDEINQWFNPAAFKINALGTIGTGRRNQLHAPGLWNLDYSAFKDFALKEQLKVQLRGELFNAFNHANLNGPNTTVTSPLFGKITSAGAPRIVQLALKVIF